MRVEVTIEQLVLAGIPAADADQVRDAIEAELSHVLGQADPAAFTSGAVPTVRAQMPTTPGAGPTGIGTAVGAILGNTVAGGGGGA
jgi:Tfp pilus assembly PilM family ATPase